MSTGIDNSFSQLLKRHRRAAGLTQEQLAERANLSVRGLSDLERGVKTRPHADTVEMLADALDLSPDDRHIFRSAVRRDRGPYSVRSPTVSLPAESTPLIGREEQESEVVHLLQVERAPLLTLTGTGGVGKTSLALRVAASLAGEFADGAAFVSLASVRDPTLVASALARALGLRPARRDSERGDLIAYFRAREMLLVLDNFEHVLDAAPLLGELLAACARLQVLVTSRARLHLRAERPFDVPPLAVPQLRGVSRVDDVACFPAVALFLERARTVKHDFELTDANASAVVAICQRMDGLPLAIELAAARIAVLPPHVLLARLAHSLGLLTHGARDAPERQRTMRDTIAWSYDLLSEAEQLVFRRVAVFVGGAGLDAIDCLCADDLSPDVLDEVCSLVDKHLLVAEVADGGARFRMLEVVREFALERLRDVGEEEAAYRRHAAYFLDLAGEAELELWGKEQAQWFRRLDAEQANLRAALEWALGHGEVELALRLAGKLWRFWMWHGDYQEWRRLIETGLAEASHVPPEVRAQALFAAAWLAQHQQDYAAATALSEENLRISYQLDDPLAIRHALSVLGMAARAAGRPDEAIPLFEETVSICRGLGNERFLAPSLFNVGLARVEAGESDRAVPLIEEALDLFRRHGEKYIATTACRTLGHILLMVGPPERARGLFLESLRLSVETGHRVGIAESMEGLAIVSGLAGRIEHAVRLLGAAEAYRDEIGHPRGSDSRVDQVAYHFTLEPYTTAHRAQLGEERWQALRAEGRGMAPDEALRRAMGEDVLR